MLPKKNRLTTRYEFDKVRKVANKDGTKISGKYFHFFYMKQKDIKNPTKVGIVVSNKFNKSAVVRNRVKRLFREVFLKNFDKIRDGYWVVIHPKFVSIGKSYEEINADFNKILQKIPLAR